MSGKAYEVNLDGLPGPTHNFAGLSYGNLASMRHGMTVSNPRAAALQCLEKMKLLADLGLRQAVLPPHERPDIETLRRLGFRGTDAEVVEKAGREAPEIFLACCSASAMWTANAATVSPSADTGDGRVHITPANLAHRFHRSIEPATTGLLLKAVFRSEAVFAHHPPLPPGALLSDEGAANHTRLCRDYGTEGIELFVHGASARESAPAGPSRYPARQTREASESVARLHRLSPARTVFARQNPAVIDAGVFHNDVIAVGNRNVMLYHSLAWAGGAAAIEEMKRKFQACCRSDLLPIEVSPRQLSVDDAVRTYFFNSQLVTLPSGAMCLVTAAECEQDPAARRLTEEILGGDNPIGSVRYVDLGESMKNGGGPACLRLRVVVTEEEMAGIHPGVWMDDRLHGELAAWARRHHRDRLLAEELSDPLLLAEGRAALDELTRILSLGPVYSFQREGRAPGRAGNRITLPVSREAPAGRTRRRG